MGKYPQALLPVRVKFYLSKQFSSVAAFKITQNIAPRVGLIKALMLNW